MKYNRGIGDTFMHLFDRKNTFDEWYLWKLSCQEFQVIKYFESGG